MDFSFTNKRPLKMLYLKYTLVFIFLAACIFGTYLLTGHTFILSKDALNQHVPLLANYRQALINFFIIQAIFPSGHGKWVWGPIPSRSILTTQLVTFSPTSPSSFRQLK